MQRLRRQRNLSQADIAAFAGVSPSAISQAESGRRGLSLVTLLVLGEHLGVGIDALLDNRPTTGYVLARRPATSATVAPLLDDPEQGLLTYLVRLGPGAEGAPPFSFKGIELIAVASGLIQLTVGPETPVMRAGDVVLTARDPVRGWRDLSAEPAMFFWILKT
ncbi:MAG TPA: XRE family transcriptional regulator [Acidimicrobiales bacterium]|nr:XRE family transcriptional regulator [Acidimicrobiales bacterium]